MCRRSALLLASIWALAAGCSSDGNESAAPVEQTAPTTTVIESPTTETPTQSTTGQPVTSFQLLAAGAEPLVTLEAAQVAAAEIRVEAVDASSLTVDGDTTESEATARYLLRVDATVGDAPSLIVVHDVQELIADQPAPSAEDLDAWRFGLDEHGLVEYIGRGTTVALTTEAAGLLTAPSLRLPTPTEPVGVGAQWAYPLDESGDVVATVTLTGMTEAELNATIEFTATNDDGSISMLASGTYDRATLLAVDVQVTSTFVVDTEVTMNERVTTMTGTETSRRSYVGGT